MNYLLKHTPILSAIPDEDFSSMNAGYEYGKTTYAVVCEEDAFYYQSDDSRVIEIVGTLPEESKIC